MHWRRITVTGVALCVLVADGLSAQAPSFEIKLRSRAFTPESTTEEARAYLSKLDTDRGHLVLQLASPGDPWERARLERAGVRFLQYVPDNSWYVSAPVDVLEDPAVDSLIRWAGRLGRENRLHPRLIDAEVGPWARTHDGRWKLYVRFHSDTEMSVARGLLAEVGAEITREYESFRSFTIICTPDVMDAIVESDPVFWVREIAPPPVEANDGARDNTHAGNLQDPPYSLDGTGITVGIWDSGPVDDTHPDFFGRIFLGDGGGTSSHGTHCAGSIGGDGSNSQSHGGDPLQWRGMAPAVTLVSYDWNGPIGEYNEAINTYGASVSSNSWIVGVDEGQGNCDIYGDYDFSAPEYDEIIRELHGAPITICFAAGNERDDGDCGMGGPPYDNYGVIPPPGTAKNMITVGAINSNNDSMTNFSSWGPVDDGRIKPEVVAPGCQSNGDGGLTSTLPGGGYTSWCGTSMATPTTSGCVALLTQTLKDTLGEIPPASLVKALLVNTARDLGNVGPDYSFGFGAVDVQAAVDQVLERAYVTGEVTNLFTNNHRFEVPEGTSRAQVTLCWSDPPAAPNAEVTLINNLDLKLIGPVSGEHLPWTLTPGVPDDPAEKRVNYRDVVEQITVDDPEPGIWIARVSGTNVPQGPQEYSVAGLPSVPPCEGVTLQVPLDHSTLQAAVNAAQECDTILVAPGTYQESLDIDKPLVILSESGPEVTRLEAPYFQRVMSVSADILLDGFTIMNGYAFGSFPSGNGGGIYADNASMTIRNCTIKGCFANQGGGAIYALGGYPTIEACVVDSNETDGPGGGICLQNSWGAVVEGCVIYGNEAGTHGGGIAHINGTAEIHQNTVVGNFAGTSGGGLYQDQLGGAVIRANIVASNAAPAAGGIACDGTEDLSCNDVWNNGEDYADCPAGTDEFSADPLFCDPSSGDFGIPSESPCAAENSPAGCGRVGAHDAEECGVVDVPQGGGVRVPNRFAVYPAVPNPLTRSTRIRFDLAERSSVSLVIYDVSGRVVRTLAHDALGAGSHSRVWDGLDTAGRHAAAGVYFYRLVAGEHRVTRKLIVLP